MPPSNVGGSVQVGRVGREVMLVFCPPDRSDGPTVTFSAESVQELIAALVKARREVFGSDWASPIA